MLNKIEMIPIEPKEIKFWVEKILETRNNEYKILNIYSWKKDNLFYIEIELSDENLKDNKILSFKFTGIDAFDVCAQMLKLLGEEIDNHEKNQS